MTARSLRQHERQKLCPDCPGEAPGEHSGGDQPNISRKSNRAQGAAALRQMIVASQTYVSEIGV
jgi:hypothetical protein